MGDRLVSLLNAVLRLRADPDVEITDVSPVYESEAHTLGVPQPPYLNAVVLVRTTKTPACLLDLCKELEQDAGRASSERWVPRTLDLDLLAIGSQVEHSRRLTLPHPRLAERRFVLQPWCDIAPQLGVPAPFEATVEELLSNCTDAHALHKLDTEPLLAGRWHRLVR